MAEICCDVATTAAEAASPAANTTEVVSCKASSRSARRRRIQIRRFRFVSPVEDTAAKPSFEVGAKRRRPDFSHVTLPAILRADPCESTAESRLNYQQNGSKVDNSSSERGESLEYKLGQARGVIRGGATDRWPRYGMISVCGRRRDMEDAVSLRPNFLRRDPGVAGEYHFFGVYDGHGCSHVATACGNRMHELVAEEMSTVHSGPSQPPESWWRSVMQRSFSRMDAAVDGLSSDERPIPVCRCELLTPKCNHVGSTAVVAVVGPRQIVVSNCGDSRAVLCRNGEAIPLSSDHKPDRPDELRRIESAGGRVIYWDGARVFGVLAMSRAIGDSYLKPFVIPEPEVTVTERSENDECLILASDGLWDVVSNEMACNVARMCLRSNAPPVERGGVEEDDDEEGGASERACSDAAKLLTNLALARQSADNVSVVVIDLRRRR